VFRHYTLKMVRPQCHPSRPELAAIAEVDADLREVLPYLNAELGSCYFHPDAPFLRFIQAGKAITIHPDRITITGLADEEETHRVVQGLRRLLEEVWARRDQITPSYRRGTEVKPLDVYKLLPRTNCGACGERTCLAFAGRLVKQELALSDCTPLYEPVWEPKREELVRLLTAAGYPA